MKEQTIFTKTSLALITAVCLMFVGFILTQTASAEHLVGSLGHNSNSGGGNTNAGCGTQCSTPQEFTAAYNNSGTQSGSTFNFMQMNCIVVSGNDCGSGGSGSSSGGGTTTTGGGCQMVAGGPTYSSCGTMTPVNTPTGCTGGYWVCNPGPAPWTPPSSPPPTPVTLTPATCSTSTTSTQAGKTVELKSNLNNPNSSSIVVQTLELKVGGITYNVNPISPASLFGSQNRDYSFDLDLSSDGRFSADTKHPVEWTYTTSVGTTKCGPVDLVIEKLFAS